MFPFELSILCRICIWRKGARRLALLLPMHYNYFYPIAEQHWDIVEKFFCNDIFSTMNALSFEVKIRFYYVKYNNLLGRWWIFPRSWCKVWLSLVSTSRSLDYLRRRPNSAGDARLEALALNVLRQETWKKLKGKQLNSKHLCAASCKKQFGWKMEMLMKRWSECFKFFFYFYSPPTNASPAPLVSTTFSSGSLVTGNSNISLSFAIITGSEPCVMITTLFLLSFIFSRLEILRAISLRSVAAMSLALAKASSSSSLPNSTST